LYILPEVNCSDDWVQAYESLGFHADPLDKSNPICKVFTRKSVIKLSTFTNRIMWARYGHYLTLKEVTEDGVQVIQNFMSCLMGQLLLRPMDSGACIAMRFPASVLEHVISGTTKFNGADLNKCVNGAMELVKRFTRISLSIFTHAIVSRFKSGKGPSKLIHETTLELLQFVSVALIQMVPYHEWYIGEKNINVSCIVKNAIQNLAGVETYSKFL
jgi:hypothetical protein